MNKFFSVFLMLCALLGSSCARTRNDVWEDSKSAGRHVNRGVRSLGGKQSDSRQVKNREDFRGQNNYEFVPLLDEEGNPIAMNDMQYSQSLQTPGEAGSTLPGIESFQDPKNDPQLASIFKNISFPYDSNLVKGDENMSTIKNIANYLNSHPNTYIFVEGHCDENGAEAYNLALGARRSNAVRNLLIEQGANPDHIFTISYGKERPLAFGHGENFWSTNRRAEFKVYTQ